MRARAGLLALLCAWPLAAGAVEPAPRLEAAAWLLVDAGTGDVLVAHADRQPLPPASLTKLMTAYLVFAELRAGRLHLDEPVRMSPRAARTGGSRIDLAAGAEARVEELIKSMLLRSANNAAVALAERVAGSEEAFVARMNAQARAWGLEVTRFANSSGLDAPGHHASARDLTRIAAALLRDFPDYYDWFGLRDFEFRGRPVRNGNRLLWRDAAVDGMKTGYTRGARWCMIASARQQHTRLIATVLGAPTRRARAGAAQQLLDYGFRNYETRLVHRSAEALAEARVWMGTRALVPVGLLRDLYVTLPRGAYPRLATRVSVEPAPLAPVDYGEPLGSLTVALDDRVLGTWPLAALDPVPQGGWLQRTLDNVYLWLR
jgi:D-alanyl-D-alanine carboxypeptidase (penicillin-binding protein 5/6)